MDAVLSVLVVLVGVPLVFAVCLLLVYGRVAFAAAGWALARWASGEPWRPPAICALFGLLALGVAVWSARLDARFLFVFFVVELLWFLMGVTGFDYADEAGGEPGNWNEGWRRRSRW